MRRGRFLTDVDGVVGDLMGRHSARRSGFRRWLWEERGIDFDPNAAGNLRTTGIMRDMLLEFLSLPDVFIEYVDPIENCREAIGRIQQAGLDVVFVTSVSGEPLQVPAKFRWLSHYFGHVPYSVYTVPSTEKQHVAGDFMVDDRADIIYRFMETDNRSGLFLFDQPWNFAYGEDGPPERAPWRHPKRWEFMTDTMNEARALQAMDKDPLTVPLTVRTDSWSMIEFLVKDHYDIG